MTKPNAHDVHAMILHAAKHQIATMPEAKRIAAAGLDDDLRNLIEAISANAANPIAYRFGDND